MVKADVFSIQGKKLKTVELPQQFAEEHRPDLIRRVHLALQSHMRQPYGAFPEAGLRASAKLSRRRRKYKTAYGHGISRVPRKASWKRGTQFGWSGAVAPGTVSGRKAHHPKAEKVVAHKINRKERKKAIRSALAITLSKELVQSRGHQITHLPAIVEDKIEAVAKTKDVEKIMKALGLEKEIVRVARKKVRAGKGKRRGRKYKTKKGPLIVVAEKCKLEKAGANILGVDVRLVNKLNVNDLAPGGVPGRLTLYSEKALEKMKKDNLFIHVTKKQAVQT